MEFEAFRESERMGWNARARGYDTATAGATLQSIPMLLHMARLRSGARLLDMGCGPGYLAGAAAALGGVCTGIDFAEDMVTEAQARFPGVTFHGGDAEALRFDDASFDIVASNIVLFHLANPEKAMAEAARVLRPGGVFVFSQWLGPDQSDLYRELQSVLREHADVTLGDAAPDAYALSEPATARAALEVAGFETVESRVVHNILGAADEDFFDFFMRFGVRVPLIVQAQAPSVQTAIREAMNERMEAYRTARGIEVPMPSILYSGQKP